jgi:amino acid transporter
MTLIGVVAIVNGVLIQMIMASRVFYGLASRGQAPAPLQRVSPVTRTPILATALTAVLVMLLALAGDISVLAQLTSVIMLVLFAMANLSLWLIKRRLEDAQLEGFRLPKAVPLLASMVCAGVAVRGLYDLLS